MLTAEDNAFLCQVGRGTPAGEWLRRYWYPICPVTELTQDTPKRHVKLLGEDLVLFKDGAGRIGLLIDRCSHRGVSLSYGRIHDEGIACAYHGWLYDVEGNILQTPAEQNDAITRTVKHRAYQARKYAGLYWAYLGPAPAPELPKWDVLERKDGRLEINIYQPVNCNWLQSIENSADPDHRQLLHQEYVGGSDRETPDPSRGRFDDVTHHDLYKVPYGGIMKVRHFKNGLVESHPLILPTILRQGQGLQYRQPMDDYHIWEIRVNFKPNKDGSLRESDDDIIVNYIDSHRLPGDQHRHEPVHYRMDRIAFQDYMCWETQGPITDRTTEHLGYSDRCIVMFRDMVKENIRRVLEGEDPDGTFRDPHHEPIDTRLAENLGTLGAPESPDVPFVPEDWPPIVPRYYANAQT